MHRHFDNDIQRRTFLSWTAHGFAAFIAGTRAPALLGADTGQQSLYAHLPGALQPPDANGLRLPPGFKSRIVARSSRPVVAGSSYIWHGAPDGGACFATPDGGWVYVSNSEIKVTDGGGGVGALRFDAEGTLIDAYSLLSGTDNNCAGGKTPWQTWLSCEEVARGLVYECDPLGKEAAVALPALGRFKHEAVAVDPVHAHLYLTEDEEDGLFYRFVPAAGPERGRPAGCATRIRGRRHAARLARGARSECRAGSHAAPGAGGHALQRRRRHRLA